MLTTEGKNHIKRYLAGYTPSIVQCMAMGVGTQSETMADAGLQFEVTRSPIALTTYDFAANKLIYKASVPDDYVGSIREIGLYTLDQDPNVDASRIITTFDSATEDWVTSGGAYATFSSTATRIGTDSLLFAPAASASTTYYLNDLGLDLSGYSGSDVFSVLFNVANTNTNFSYMRFMTDANNFFQFNLTGLNTTGYKHNTFNKSAAAVTGTPSWANITTIMVSLTANAGGAASVELDGIRLENRTSLDLDYILVARKVLATPTTKVEGRALDIEFALDVTL